MDSSCAVVRRPTETSLWTTIILGDFVKNQATKHGPKDIAVFPWQGVRLSYAQLAERGKSVAKALLKAGARPTECVAVLAGNRYEYLESVVGGALIGCSVLVLHTTYKPWELQNALEKTSRSS